MNQDDRIDELLNDLDTALSVEPSPAVAAKVRARIAAEPARGWWGVVGQRAFFVGQTFRSAGYALVLLIAVAAAYLMWPSNQQAPVIQQTTALPPTVGPGAPEIVTPSAPKIRSAPSATTTSRPRTSRATTQVAVVAREPEVLVSPGTRLAIEQMQTAVRTGRVTAESFSATPVSTELDVITVTPIVIDVVKIEPPATNSGGGGTVR